MQRLIFSRLLIICSQMCQMCSIHSLIEYVFSKINSATVPFKCQCPLIDRISLQFAFRYECHRLLVERSRLLQKAAKYQSLLLLEIGVLS